jgi:hypothetical protein
MYPYPAEDTAARHTCVQTSNLQKVLRNLSCNAGGVFLTTDAIPIRF